MRLKISKYGALITVLRFSMAVMFIAAGRIDAGAALCHTPSFPQDSIEVIRVRDTVQKRMNVWRKIYHYFADANVKKDKRLDISVIGGPHYSSDTKLGLGLVAAGVYNTHRGDSITPESNISLFGDITTTGFWLLGVRGNNIFYAAKWRIDYTAYFFSFPSGFWGIGYTLGDSDDNACKYMRHQAEFKSDFMFSVAQNLYIGPSVGFRFISGANFTENNLGISGEEMLNSADRITRYASTGAALTYDSRDFIPNAYKGVYFNFVQRIFTDFSHKPFFSTDMTFDVYKVAWKGAIFAFDANTVLQYGPGDVPWTMKTTLGGSNRLRGYYDGRYRDDNSLQLQVEYRQKIYNRHGIVLWGGCGTIWSKNESFKWKNILPNYGVGYRWEFKKRMNVRLDYGFGKNGQSSFLFSINEAF